jgi:hypothetical protein
LALVERQAQQLLLHLILLAVVGLILYLVLLPQLLVVAVVLMQQVLVEALAAEQGAVPPMGVAVVLLGKVMLGAL